MDEKIEKLLGEEFVKKSEELQKLGITSEGYSNGIENLKILNDIISENTKNKIEDNYRKSQIQEQLEERKLKERQLEEQVTDRYFKIGVEAAGIVLPLMFYAIWMRKGFEFEKEGTFTSGTFRNLYQKFKTTKK